MLDDLGSEERPREQQEHSDQHRPGDLGAFPHPVGVEPVHRSSRMANHSRNAARMSRVKSAVVSACSGLYRVTSASSGECEVPLATSSTRSRSQSAAATKPAYTARLSAKKTARPQATR